MKKVLDGDLQIVLETFDPKDTQKVLEKYENDERWEDVGIDCDGDIVLYEEL